MRMAHVALWTTDLETSAHFWAETFGATVGEEYASRRRPGFRSRFVQLGDGAAIELMTGPWVAARPTAEEHVGWAHVAVSLGSEDAVRALAGRLSATGALVSPPRLTGDGYYEAIVRTPEGALVEITS